MSVVCSSGRMTSEDGLDDDEDGDEEESSSSSERSQT